VIDVGLTHVALPARDLERSIDFYARYARMQVVHRREGAVWLSDKTRPFVVVLLEAPEIGTPLLPVSHLGVACESREEVDRLCTQAAGEGCLIGGPNDYGPPVGYWAFLRDPDGHTLEVSHGQEVGLAVARSRSE
jgi:catechol 2,3-dioxygenase-like lactoylglutathione lyase family enzyme